MQITLNVPLLIKELAGSDPSVCECGAGSSALSFSKMTLIEPHPVFYRKAVEKFPDATIHNVAIVPKPQPIVELQLHGEQTHLSDIDDCPVAHRTKPQGEIVKVPALTFDQIDTGFDVVILDMEGAEWFALQNMTSRPRFLMIETHSSSTFYVNPYLKEIQAWIRSNHYTRLYKGISNTIWLHRNSTPQPL